MSGPLPKPPHLRQRRHRTSTAAQLSAPPARRVPLPRSRDWHPATRRWWRAIWTSPMCAEWVDADVPRLVELAVLRDAFWASGDPRIAAEIRQGEREFGLSPMARRSLQWEIRRVEGIKPRPSRAPSPGVLTVLEGTG